MAKWNPKLLEQRAQVLSHRFRGIELDTLLNQYREQHPKAQASWTFEAIRLATEGKLCKMQIAVEVGRSPQDVHKVLLRVFEIVRKIRMASPQKVLLVNCNGKWDLRVQ